MGDREPSDRERAEALRAIVATAASEDPSEKLDEGSSVRSEPFSTDVDVLVADRWWRVSTTSSEADALFLALLGEGTTSDRSGEFDLREATLAPLDAAPVG